MDYGDPNFVTTEEGNAFWYYWYFVSETDQLIIVSDCTDRINCFARELNGFAGHVAQFWTDEPMNGTTSAYVNALIENNLYRPILCTNWAEPVIPGDICVGYEVTAGGGIPAHMWRIESTTSTTCISNVQTWKNSCGPVLAWVQPGLLYTNSGLKDKWQIYEDFSIFRRNAPYVPEY